MRRLSWLAALCVVSPCIMAAAQTRPPEQRQSPAQPAPAAEPAIKLPSCEPIDFWAAQVNLMDTFNVAPKLTLPKAFQDAYLVPLFGVPAAAWTTYDVQAASQVLMACYQEAGKRRNQIDASALTNANRALVGLLPRTNDALRKARSDADTIRKDLDALPPSAELGRGIDSLVKANPAAPDLNIIRGLPRPVADPIWRLAQVELTLSDADRDSLWTALGERRRAMETSLAEDAAKRIVAASSDAAGVMALMDIHRRVEAMSDTDARAKLIHDADDKAATIRDTLRQAKLPSWTPPSCLELYRWSGVPNSGGVTPLGRRGVAVGLLDERVIPVFGLSIADWTDEDVARFKTLRAFCRAASVILPGTPAPDKPERVELVQIANRGRWIENADQQIADARAGIGDYRKARVDLAALRTKLQVLPDTLTSIATLAQSLNDPVLAAVSQDDRTAFAAAVAEKRASVGAHLAEAAVKGVDAIKVASVADLKTLFQFAAQTMPQLPDQRGQQVFALAFNRDLDDATKRLLPEFITNLNTVPATVDGLGQVKTAEAAIGDGGRVAGLRPFHEVAHARFDAIARTVREHSCLELLSSLGVGGDASQDLWDGDKGIRLGDFICGLAEHGVTVNAYSGAGLFSSTSTLKVTPIKEGLQVVSLHKAEVKAGVSMLAGVRIVDANGQPVGISAAPAGGVGGGVAAGSGGSANGNSAVSTAAWENYARQAKGDSASIVEACKPLLAAPPTKPGPGETLFWLHCGSLPDVQRAMVSGAR